MTQYNTSQVCENILLLLHFREMALERLLLQPRFLKMAKK